jgi:hypothetical protein
VSRAAAFSLGVVPLLLFAAYFAMAWQRGRAADSLWMCHAANVLLSAGIFARAPRPTGAAVLWIVIGLPLWAMDAWLAGETTAVSAASHLGGLAVGLYALHRLRLSSNPWLAALLVFVALREACRWLTPAALNVNLAHAPYRGWEIAYWQYWLITTAAAAGALWALGAVLTRISRETREGT